MPIFPRQEKGDSRDYSADYSEQGVLNKVLNVIPMARSRQGAKLISSVMQLYYLTKTPGVPVWVKGTVIAALAYFIVTPDAIPDITPVVGFVDDLAVLASALTAVASYISPGLKKRVEEILVSLKIRSVHNVTIDQEPLNTN